MKYCVLFLGTLVVLLSLCAVGEAANSIQKPQLFVALGVFKALRRKRKIGLPAHAASRILGSKDTLEELMASFLDGSSLIYGYAKLRKLVRDHDIVINHEAAVNRSKAWFGIGHLGKSKLVPFNRTNLVVTQASSDDQRPFRYLKYDISASMIREFIQKNRRHLKQEDNGDIVFMPKGQLSVPLPIEKQLEELEKFDGEIVEIDDEFSTEELVYGITVNRSERRITVFFRGSVVGGKDWTTNINAKYRVFPTPQRLKKQMGDREIKVHEGFYRYLFDTTADSDEITKFDEVVGALREIYREYPGYTLYVSGHSLGGALVALLSFSIASLPDSESRMFPMPVQAISFASPQVGNADYNCAFEILENQNRLRHVRVTNQGDVVPELPLGFGYTQTGVNIHAFAKKPASVGYRNLKRVPSQIQMNSGAKHSLDDHDKNIFARNPKNGTLINSNVLSKTIEELYRDAEIKNFTKKE